jgi:hypothetical protein
MTQKTSQNPWSLDVRVRERNLKSGVLTEKDLDKHLGSLPDVADQAEPFAIGQPALADHARHVEAAAASDAGADDDDDEAEDGEGAP